MAESRLKVILETSGTGKIKSARTSVDLLKKAVQGLDAALKKTIPLQAKVARGFDTLKAKALGAARGIKGAAKSLSSLQGVLGGIAVGALFKGAIDEAVKYEAAILRISRLEGQFKNLEGLQKQAADTAKNLFVSQTQAAQGYANLASRIGSSVGSVKELQAVYEGLEIVLLKNAKSTQEAASLQLQLNQALGKGTLNGDEFRTIAENAPEILRQLAKDAGVAESAIKDLSSEGFVTTEKLIKALANLRNSGIDDFNALLETTLGKIRKYDKAVADLQLTIGRDLLPAITPLIEALTFIAQAFAALPEPVRKVILATTALLAIFSVLAPVIAGITLSIVVLGGKFVIAAALVASLGLALFELPNILQTVANEFAFVGQFFIDVWKELNVFVREFWRQTIEDLGKVLEFFRFNSVAIFEGIGNAWEGLTSFMGEVFTQMLNGLSEELNKFFAIFQLVITDLPGPVGGLLRGLRLLGNIQFPTFELGEGLKGLELDFPPPSGNLPGDSSGGAGSKKAAKERKQKEKDKAKELQQNARLLLQQEEIKRSAIEGLIKENQYLQLRITKGKEFADTFKQVRELMEKGVDFKTATDLVELNNGLKEAVTETEALEQQMKDLKVNAIEQVTTAIQDGIVASLEAAITGAEDLGSTLQSIASDLLKSLGKMFLNAGFSGLQSSLFPNLFPMASGGYVSSPTPALVGEGGQPEYVIPQSKMDSAMSRWAAGQSGSQVLADGGEMVGGGVALADQPPQININGGVMQVGGEDYVRMDQIPSIIAQSSKAGEARALRALQMSPAVRRKAGV